MTLVQQQSNDIEKNFRKNHFKEVSDELYKREAILDERLKRHKALLSKGKENTAEFKDNLELIRRSYFNIMSLVRCLESIHCQNPLNGGCAHDTSSTTI